METGCAHIHNQLQTQRSATRVFARSMPVHVCFRLILGGWGKGPIPAHSDEVYEIREITEGYKNNVQTSCFALTSRHRVAQEALRSVSPGLRLGPGRRTPMQIAQVQRSTEGLDRKPSTTPGSLTPS
jgi:hypothetical protein